MFSCILETTGRRIGEYFQNIIFKGTQINFEHVQEHSRDVFKKFKKSL